MYSTKSPANYCICAELRSQMKCRLQRIVTKPGE